MKNTHQSKPSVRAVQATLAREPRVYDFVQYCYESKGEDAAMAIELSASDFSPEFDYPGPNIVVVLITLPARLVGDLDAIASSEPSIYNEYSPDLLENYSYIAFKGNEFEVRLDLWRLHRFPEAIHDGVIFFTFIAADRVAVGQVEASEDLEEVSQGACISSGPNYKPRRDWSEEAITAAQNEPEAPNDTVVTIRNYAKYLGERERRQ